MRFDRLVWGLCLVGAICCGGWSQVGFAQLNAVPAPAPQVNAPAAGFQPGRTTRPEDWNTARTFSVLLTERELAGFYPVSIEGRVDAEQQMQFRAVRADSGRELLSGPGLLWAQPGRRG